MLARQLGGCGCVVCAVVVVGGGVHQVEIPSGRVGSNHPCNACLGSTGGVAVQ